MKFDNLLIEVVYHLEADLNMDATMAGLIMQKESNNIGVSNWHTTGALLKVYIDNPEMFNAFVTANPEWAVSRCVTRVGGGAS
jgi:hypothetical protein